MNKRVLICLAFSLLLNTAFAQALPARSEKLRGTRATYDGEPRLANGRVDVTKLVSELADLHANTYNWLIWHASTDWDDLKIFLPLARKKKINVWVTLVPPSESPPLDANYSEPFRLDYERWAKEIARLSVREKNLIAWSLDDFSSANTSFFTPEKLRSILDGAHKINPNLAFVPCCYYPQINAAFVQKYQGLFDGVLFPYLSESAHASMTNSTRVEAEVREVKANFGSVPVFIDVYATGYSSLGKTTPQYVREVMENGHRCADGILIYCHQDKTQAPEKYNIIKELFSRWSFAKPVDAGVEFDSRKALAETDREFELEIHASGGPICSVKREVYVASPKAGVAPQAAVSYLGKGLRRREIHALQSKSDLAEKVKVRFSDDNGRSWTPFTPLDSGHDALRQGTNSMEELIFAINYDPVARRTIEMVFQRIFIGEASQSLHRFWKGEKAFYDHGMYRLSRDDGRSWTKERQLGYEPGAAFDPQNWTNPSYLNSNQMYGSYEVTILRNGEIAYPAVVPVPYEDEEDRKMAASFPKYVSATGNVGGVTCFIGKWNKRKDDYDWTSSKPVFVPRRISARGMSEPVIAELADGRLLLEMRGSNAGLDPVKYPGRRWMSISSDHGRNWTPITDLRYDTGEQFYAPSTMARFIRSHKTGKLYWIGNISSKPAEGNLPRYPLYIVEVDEKIPALKKNTMTIIDDRAPQDTAAVQFSNFTLLENRQTRDLEIYLTRLGENAGSTFSANAYKYTLKIR